MVHIRLEKQICTLQIAAINFYVQTLGGGVQRTICLNLKIFHRIHPRFSFLVYEGRVTDKDVCFHATCVTDERQRQNLQ